MRVGSANAPSRCTRPLSSIRAPGKDAHRIDRHGNQSQRRKSLPSTASLPTNTRASQKILGRDPNFTELGIFSVMWSEHCSYKSSRVHLKRLPTRGTHVVQGPGENAGVVDIGDGLVAVFKIESHNHPSFVEPFQGAATGVGGILRDIFTMGARPIAVLDSLRFGPITPGPDGQRNAEEIARNRRILDGVVRGIALLRQLLRRAHRRRRSRFRAVLLEQSAGQRACARHRAPRGDYFSRSAAASAIR